MPMITRAIKILFTAFLFAFPFSLRFLIAEDAAYRFGNFNPWVSEFVYAPEILLAIVFFLWIYQNGFSALAGFGRRFRAILAIGALFLLNVLVVSFWRGDLVPALFFLLRAAEAVALYLLITRGALPPKKIVRILLVGAAFQVALSVVQWALNRSFGLPLLGEPAIGSEILNVAKTQLTDGAKHIRPYGTFLHPNILAAYLLTVLFIAFDALSMRQRLFWLLLLGFGVYFTQSLAALGVGAAALGFWLLVTFFRVHVIRRGVALLLLTLLVFGNAVLFAVGPRLRFSDPSFSERVAQSNISRAMAAAHPFGVGVRNFTLESESFSSQKLKPWEFQPVHNTYFLILNETGIQGLALLLLALFLLFDTYWVAGKALPLVSLLLLAPFDHFLWDSWAGIMLVSLAAAFFTLHNRTPEAE